MVEIHTLSSTVSLITKWLNRPLIIPHRKCFYLTDKYLPNILSIFKNKQSHPDSDSDLIKSNLEQLLTTLPDFTQQKYTLFYTSIDEDVGPCPPCRQQEKTIDMLKSKFSDKQLKVHSISINASDNGI